MKNKYRIRQAALGLIIGALIVLLANLTGLVGAPRPAEATFVAYGYGPFSPETQELVEATCGYSMATSTFYEHTQTRKGYLAMLKVHNGVDDLYRCVKTTTRLADAAPAPVSTSSEAEWFSAQTDEYRYSHMHELPAADPGMTWAEDGTQVPLSYYSEPAPTGGILAEDGSYVNPDFYSKTDYNRNGVTDQEEGYPPNPNPADVY